MIALETWINPTKKIDEPVRIKVSDRFVDPETGEAALWTLTPVDANKSERIQTACMEDTRNIRTGTLTKQLNGLRYLNGLTAATVTDPPVQDKDFQKALGVSSAVDAINTMLSPSEKNTLAEEINRIYQLNPSYLEDAVEDAKNE